MRRIRMTSTGMLFKVIISEDCREAKSGEKCLYCGEVATYELKLTQEMFCARCMMENTRLELPPEHSLYPAAVASCPVYGYQRSNREKKDPELAKQEKAFRMIDKEDFTGLEKWLGWSAKDEYIRKRWKVGGKDRPANCGLVTLDDEREVRTAAKVKPVIVVTDLDVEHYLENPDKYRQFFPDKYPKVKRHVMEMSQEEAAKFKPEGD